MSVPVALGVILQDFSFVPWPSRPLPIFARKTPLALQVARQFFCPQASDQMLGDGVRGDAHSIRILRGDSSSRLFSSSLNRPSASEGSQTLNTSSAAARPPQVTRATRLRASVGEAR
jgi:hypothetical protein